jgi:hypothetical protein
VFVDNLDAGAGVDDANAVRLALGLGEKAGPDALMIVGIPAFHAVGGAGAALERGFHR